MTDSASLLYRIKLVEQQVTALFEKQLGISLTRYCLLTHLLEQDGISQQDLQAALQIDRAAITRHLKILEEAGYVERHRKQDNQREMVVRASQKAVEDLVLSPPAHHLAVKAVMETILTSQEERLLHSLLDKLVAGLHQLPLDTIPHRKGE